MNYLKAINIIERKNLYFKIDRQFFKQNQSTIIQPNRL